MPCPVQVALGVICSRFAQDFVTRKATLNGSPCKLLHRQAREVPLSVAGRGPEARGGPMFSYAPFVNSTGSTAPASVQAELVTPILPGGNRANAEADVPVSISNGQLVGVDGQPLALKGVNWCTPVGSE